MDSDESDNVTGRLGSGGDGGLSEEACLELGDRPRASGPMTPDQWQQARKLFEALCDLPQAQQVRQLDAAGLDPAIERRVRAMLAAEHDGRLGDRLADQAPALATQIAHADRTSQRVGPYTIGGLLGRGGMGEIYRARRSDGSYEQDVAIKFVTLPTPDLASRFDRERQLLASFDHPGIARLLDGGVEENGTPYLVMEFIQGEDIAAYCDRHRHTIQQRIALFLSVIDAVSAAHRQLIVHRDIKPGNVLVTAEGQVKLIDFGIGKFLAAGDLQQAATLTHQQLLTPSYAAPEQLTGGRIGTHTDSFQLGLLLDELVCGLPARSLGDASIEQVVSRCLAAVEPAHRRLGNCGPASAAIARSRRTTPDRLHRQLTGDLDLILKKASAIDPELRYRNVDDLAEDLRSYLAHRPVRARKPSGRYLLSKFVRRHRLAVWTSAAAVTALIGALGVSVLQTREAERQRGIAALEGSRHQQVKEFLIDIFHHADPSVSRQRDISAQELIARASAQLDERNMDPLTAASIHQAVGRAYLGLGIPETALTHLKHALELFEAQEQTHHGDYADTLFLTGQALQTGTYADATRYHQQALDLRRALHGDDHPDVAASLLAVARALRSTQDHDLISATYEKALAAISRYAGQDSRDYAQALTRMGSYYGSRGELETAFPIAQQAYTIATRVMPENDPELGSAALLLGTLGSDTGRFDIGHRHLGEALAIFEETLGPNHPRSLSALGNLSVLSGHQGNFEALLARSREYRDRLIDVFGPESPKAAYGWAHLGLAYFSAGRYEQALQAQNRAVAIIDAVEGEPGSNSGNLVSRGRSLLRLGRYGEALNSADRALAATMGPRNRSQALTCRAEALLSLGRPDAGLKAAQQALELAAPLSDPLLVSEIHSVLAQIHRAAGNSARARIHLHTVEDLLDGSPFFAADVLRRNTQQALQELAAR
ncbi:MAG: serine/threonine-protein kinase [Xanthomonadales bacterium]|nr:serine/threonine-protein kinase [Xanthomonadales bacterium]